MIIYNPFSYTILRKKTNKYIKNIYNNLQNSLIKEDTRKVDPNALAPESINNKLFKIIAFIGFLLLLALIFRKRKKYLYIKYNIFIL